MNFPPSQPSLCSPIRQLSHFSAAFVVLATVAVTISPASAALIGFSNGGPILEANGCTCGCAGECNASSACSCTNSGSPTVTQPGQSTNTPAAPASGPAPLISANSFTVTPVGTSAWDINGTNNPSLILVRGQTYSFSVSAIGHPFAIKTVQGTGPNNLFATGVTNNGTQSGTVTFTVPQSAPNTLFYDCENHAPMTGTITVIPEPAEGMLAAMGLMMLAFRRRRKREGEDGAGSSPLVS